MKACRTITVEMAGRRILACGALMAWMGLAGAEPPPTALEGTVEMARPVRDGGLELELATGTNHAIVKVANAAGNTPALFSRIRAAGQTVSGWGEIQLLTGVKLPLAWNVAELRRMGAGGQHAGCVADVRGQALATSPSGRFLAFKDDTGVTLLEMEPPGRAVEAGRRVHIEGNCMVEGARAIFRSPPLVDNNDIHTMVEKSGSIYLTPGRHALRLDWFNQEYPYGLEVYYEGPGLPRQRIPDSALFRQEREAGQWRWENGVDYRCYEGSWLRIPDFGALIPAKEGRVANFDTSVFTRTNEVGLEFKGYVEAPREGIYIFSTVSDDGSLLFMDEEAPVIEETGKGAAPDASPIAVRQSLREGQDGGWTRAEGTVTYASEQSGQLELELSSDTERMGVVLAESTGASPQLLLNNRIRATGICLAARTTEGQTVAGTLLAPGINQIEFWEAGTGQWSRHPAVAAGEEAGQSGEGSTNQPVLNKVEQIKRLSREQWQSGYPVKIRGVVTTVLDGGVFIEDSTGSIYGRWRPPTDSDVPRVGDYWEIEGKTFAEFAPNIQVSRAARLGAGTLPEPLRPTWDQLINGSLDTEYVEVQGIITAVNGQGVRLLTRSGELGLELMDMQPQAYGQYDNALIRVRGCVIPVRDIHTQQVEPGRIRLSNASITVDEAGPRNLFATPLKHASDLLLFDWRAGALQRVKIAGQILHEREGEYFLMDGNDGLRFIPKVPGDLHPGDLAEAVGYLELSAPSPVLREAVARRTGRAKLPEPQILAPEAMLSRRYDATLVRVRGQLIGMSRETSEEVLEVQAGTRGFVARLNGQDGRLPALSAGSVLEITGVYAGQGGDLGSGREVTSFELLLNSGSDVRTLARAPWWTARRALAVVGGMVLVLLVGLVWIGLLRRQVEERTRQLAMEIRRHEQTERQRELEEERSRIARDLHDDLGATLTQIRFLSALESRDPRAPESTRSRMGQVSEKSREMVASLDEIVWAVNPANDSLASLANYLCHLAEEFFRATPVRCRLDVADALPSAPLRSEVRHHLYLAVREALNNIAKHSEATEVWLRIHALEPELRIELEDNGRGFAPRPADTAGDGLANMRQRLERIGGRFECETRPGAGAICRFVLRLEPSEFDKAEGVRE
ncbi:MAG: ATP-binding protein [Verrucomicrobiota bacterium]